MSSHPREAHTELVTFLTDQPTAVARLLTGHVDDGRGNCRACGIGAQRGNHTWPCSLHAAAVAAREERHRTR